MYKPIFLATVISWIKSGESASQAPLACYSCSQEQDGKACYGTPSDINGTSPPLLLVETQSCENGMNQCKVWKLSKETLNDENQEHKILYFERSCADTCTEGCTILEHLDNRYVSCYSCCNETECNIDSSATDLHRITSLFRTTLFSIILTFILTNS